MERPKPNFHRRQLSDSKACFKAQDLDKIIDSCTNAKKDILEDMSKMNKNVKSHQIAWKSMENIFKQKNESVMKYKIPLGIQEKCKKMHESQVINKKKRLSKLLVYNDKDHITDSDLMNQEALQFFLANRREFGSPLKDISVEPQKPMNRKGLTFILSPEEIILNDIQEIRSKKSSPSKSRKLSPIKVEKLGHQVLSITKESLKGMSLRSKFIFSELKKINPKNFRTQVVNKKIDKMISSIQRIQQGYEKVKRDQAT